MALDNEQYINKLYDADYKKQEATLKQNYDANISNLQAEQTAAQKQTDANLNRTYVESQKAQQAWNEQQNAAGLSSGAMAQSDLARDTQLQADLTALRGIQQQNDADIERRKTLAKQQFDSQLQSAAASGDVNRIRDLWAAAKEQDDRLYAEQLRNEERAYNERQRADERAYSEKVLADQRAYNEQQAAAERQYKEQQTEKDKNYAAQEAAAKLVAQRTGDYSMLLQLYGMTPEQIAQLNFNPAPAASSSSSGGGYNPAPINDKGDKGDKGDKTNTSNVDIKALWDEYQKRPYSQQRTQVRTPQGLTNMLVGGSE